MSPLAMQAKQLIERTWLAGPAYDLASQAAFALESAQMLQSPETAAERAAAEDAVRVAGEALAELKREHEENTRLRERVAELEKRPSVEDVAAWLVKKAHEYNSTPKSRREPAADWLVRLASKAMRGAIRPRPSAEESADKLTRLLAPTQALRDVPDGEHYAAVHHDYHKGRDLPELGGGQ
jgi:hypothetical protein